MVWRIYLLTTNDEHLITLQGGLRGLKIETVKFIKSLKKS